MPLHYRLDLSIDPSKERFSGRAEIRVEIAAVTATILLHGAEMDVSAASVESGGRLRQAVSESGPNGALALRLAEAVDPGPATLHFELRHAEREIPLLIPELEIR